jgi:hypothetical protein
MRAPRDGKHEEVSAVKEDRTPGKGVAMSQTCPEAGLPTRRAAAMFFLSLLFLAVAAVPVQAVPEAGLGHMAAALYVLAALWLVLVVEALEGLRHCERPTRVLARLLIITLLPPFRMTLATASTDGRVWLPLLGWQPPGRELAERLERALSVPMLCIAAMILPILAVEFFGADRVSASPRLALTLQIGTAMIWLAFALEFILMVSVTEDRWTYCWRHWVDIAIIVLPLVAFLRGLRLMRAARIARAAEAAQGLPAPRACATRIPRAGSARRSGENTASRPRAPPALPARTAQGAGMPDGAAARQDPGCRAGDRRARGAGTGRCAGSMVRGLRLLQKKDTKLVDLAAPRSSCR